MVGGRAWQLQHDGGRGAAEKWKVGRERLAAEVRPVAQHRVAAVPERSVKERSIEGRSVKGQREQTRAPGLSKRSITLNTTQFIIKATI